MNVTIYHNSRCRKSREALDYLKKNEIKTTVVEYLKDLFDEQKLNEIICRLGIKPIDLIRTNEAIWKDKFKDLTMSESDLIQAMLDYPKLIERPIIDNGEIAIVARPLENIEKLF